MTRGIAPLILGYQAFDRDIRIAGVILNRVGGARHEAKLRAVIEHYTDVPVLGAVAEDERLAMAERHLGLMPCSRGRRRVGSACAAIGRIVGAQVDLDRVRALAASAGAGFDARAGPRRPRRPARPAHRHRARPRLRLLLPRRPAGAGGRGRRAGAVRHAARPAAAGHRRALHRRRLSRKPAWTSSRPTWRCAPRCARPSRTACRPTPNAAA